MSEYLSKKVESDVFDLTGVLFGGDMFLDTVLLQAVFSLELSIEENPSLTEFTD